MNKTQKKEARAELLKILKPGDTVYTVVTKVSSSGMTRHITPFIIHKGAARNISWYVWAILGYRRDDSGGNVVSGCGMDMGFHIVYNLSRSLWLNGFTCAGDRKCQSNDHSNGDRDYSKHHHLDGGYALVQKWI